MKTTEQIRSERKKVEQKDNLIIFLFVSGLLVGIAGAAFSSVPMMIYFGVSFCVAMTQV